MNKKNTSQNPLPEVLIRQAQSSDIDALCDLLAQLFAIEADFDVDRAKQIKGVKLLLGDASEASIFVAEVEEKIVAMCSVQVVISTVAGGPSAWLEDVIVDENYRQQGIATKLLTEVYGWCREQQIQRVQLLADEANPSAGQFYRQEKWQPTQLRAWRKFV